jgi:uncharacterized membrane protein YraQ (UPF0718 family)
MKAFLASIAAALVIAVIAGLALNAMDWSSANMFQSPQGSVRL